MSDLPIHTIPLRSFSISLEMLAALFTDGPKAFNVISGGVPLDAYPLDAEYDPMTRSLKITVCGKSPMPVIEPRIVDLSFKCESPKASDN